MKLKINNVPGHSGTIDIEDSNGIPVSRFWRKRLKDAKTDNCVEVVKPRAGRGRGALDHDQNKPTKN